MPSSGCCADYTIFKNVSQVGDTLLMSELENNLKTWLDWAFLNVGGFFNVTRPTSGAFGGEFDNLRLVEDFSYNNGEVWETVRKDWVWETGLVYASQPIDISGVYVNGVYYTTGDATFGHHYNYPLGRVVFDSAISTNSTVEIDHSYRWVQVARADDVEWWKELQYRSFRPDDIHFGQFGSGDWDVGAHHRIQLPAILLECISRGTSRGFELGNSSLIIEQDMLFHVLAETKHDRNQLCDILRFQNDRCIWLYNSTTIADSGAYPLDHRGMKNSGNNPIMYPTFVDTSENSGYRWKKCHIVEALLSEVESINPNLHEGTVRMTMEIIFGGI